jgi:hypothetical protein
MEKSKKANGMLKYRLYGVVGAHVDLFYLEVF